MSEDKMLVEQVARAICSADGHDFESLETSYNGRMRQRDYVRFAQAALDAIAKGTGDE